ncbi:hypothetical protein SAMN05216198_1455 [Halopseudomonas litoralis]|uniref:Uncharacterized protein n=1 Tax=Halopseudomonas litoralis TaxID=797277 RepID=A0A1H1QDG0_9GAMM|nr:hypothetical protein [Halopseudomonas litoralis]SDS21581.1 hypothetical protein SAMN05216198_1455 [Halopseudomonas litoralis]
MKKIGGEVKKAVKSVFSGDEARRPSHQSHGAIGAATYCFQSIMGSSFATSQAWMAAMTKHSITRAWASCQA